MNSAIFYEYFLSYEKKYTKTNIMIDKKNYLDSVILKKNQEKIIKFINIRHKKQFNMVYFLKNYQFC